MMAPSRGQVVSLPRVAISLEVASGVASPRALQASPGEPFFALTLGSQGDWKLEGEGIGKQHAVLHFDGKLLHIMALAGSSLTVDDEPVGSRWVPVSAPASIKLGSVTLNVHERPQGADGAPTVKQFLEQAGSRTGLHTLATTAYAPVRAAERTLAMASAGRPWPSASHAKKDRPPTEGFDPQRTHVFDMRPLMEANERIVAEAARAKPSVPAPHDTPPPMQGKPKMLWVASGLLLAAAGLLMASRVAEGERASAPPTAPRRSASTSRAAASAPPVAPTVQLPGDDVAPAATPKQAADALMIGDDRLALSLYERLAKDNPGELAYVDAVRILRRPARQR
jgi:hypothetical protein